MPANITVHIRPAESMISVVFAEPSTQAVSLYSNDALLQESKGGPPVTSHEFGVPIGGSELRIEVSDP